MAMQGTLRRNGVLRAAGMLSLVLMAGCTTPAAMRGPMPVSLFAPPSTPAEATLYVLGDNQERELFGAASSYSEPGAQELSPVAIRSLDQDLYSKFVVQQVIDDIAKEAGGSKPVILHLGDLLDYSCDSEFEKLKRMRWLHEENLFIAPGNHDVVFQGNASYAGYVGYLALLVKKIFNPTIDPTLAGHHNAVCQRKGTPVRVPADVEAMRNWPRYAGAKPRKFPTVRELPHKFRCEYLKLKAGPGGITDPSVREFCDDALFYSYYEVPKEPPRRTLVTVELPLRAQQPQFARASVAAGAELNAWSRGHLAQQILVPMQDKKSGARAGSIAFILLDTTDWSGTPSFAPLRYRSDAGKGSISGAQRATVERWIADAAANPEVVGVVLGGHYPASDLERGSEDWMYGLMRGGKVLPLYLSAHTHFGSEGYITKTWSRADDVTRVMEINVGSLIDNALHYRDLTVTWDPAAAEMRVSSRPRFVADTCNERGLEHVVSDGETSGRKFKDALPKVSGSLANYFDEWNMWCVRLADANDKLGFGGRPFTGVDHGACLDAVRNGEFSFVPPYAAAEEALMAAARDDGAMTNKLACRAAGGAAAFHFKPKRAQAAHLRFARVGDSWVLRPAPAGP